jgi:hypothetical protein
MRTSRDQGALDAPILSQSRKAQHCYLAMAAMRPDPPRQAVGQVALDGNAAAAPPSNVMNARRL